MAAISDFYLNSIRSVDVQLETIQTELDNLGLTENTIVVFTSDHGEMGGAYGLRGRGPSPMRSACTCHASATRTSREDKTSPR